MLANNKWLKTKIWILEILFFFLVCFPRTQLSGAWKQMLVYSPRSDSVLQVLSPLLLAWFLPAGKEGGLWPLQRRAVPAFCFFSSFFFFLFSFLTHTHTCMKIGSCLVSRTQKRFLSVPQHCFSRVIAVHCTGGWRRGEESMLSSNVDTSQMADRGL